MKFQKQLSQYYIVTKRKITVYNEIIKKKKNKYIYFLHAIIIYILVENFIGT